jgi:hypothetical protein
MIMISVLIKLKVLGPYEKQKKRESIISNISGYDCRLPEEPLPLEMPLFSRR